MTLLGQIIKEIDNNYMKTLWTKWKVLSLDEQHHIFSHILEKRNISVIKIVKQCDPNFTPPINHPALIHAGKVYDIELLLSVLKKNEGNEFNNDNETLISWCLKTNEFDLVLAINLEDIRSDLLYKIIYQLLIKGFDIDVNNQINSTNPILQQVLNNINQQGINIFSNPKKIYLFDMKNNEKVYTKLINYIEDDNYINQVSAHNIDGSLGFSKTATIKEIRQYLLNEMLLESIFFNKNEIASYLIKKGAEGQYKKSILLSNALEKQNLSLTKELVEAGANIHQYKEMYLECNIGWENIEICEYLISFYEDKKEAINIIEKYDGSSNKREIKKNLINYISKIYLEEKLTKELELSTIQENKIKL